MKNRKSEKFRYLETILTVDLNSAKEIKGRISVANEAFTKSKKLLCDTRLELKLRKG